MASWILLFLSSILTYLMVTHAQHSHHRPDTIPESELRPVRPLDNPTTTQTSIRDPIELPDVPYQHHWMPDYDDEYEYDDGIHRHAFTEVFQTVVYEDVTDEPMDTTSEEDEFDALHENLHVVFSAATTRENMSFLSALATIAVVLYSLLM